ncbi:MAG TPA: sigma-54-dependent Fis family transcriptional regulator, partial [Rhodospirillaceae bacterium]|nr:sigma-54-dependent Fis family transcriptional regulator [Rhodospirillaceae bacterium]
MSADILIVDDEADIRNLMRGILEDEGYKVRLAANAPEAYKAVEERAPDLVVLDIWLHGSEHDGMQILEKIKGADPALPVLMISGHGTIETAVAAIKLGAYDFIEKPFKSDRLLLMIRRALETASLRRENQQLRRQSGHIQDLIGESPQIMAFRQMLDKVAPTNSR